MAVDLLRLASHQAEQSSEMRYEVAPHFRRHSQPIENRSQMLRRRALLVAANLASRPVQQTQIIGDRHRQKSLVAAPLDLNMTAWPRLAKNRLKERTGIQEDR